MDTAVGATNHRYRGNLDKRIELGGDVALFKAGAALKLGDAVYLSGASGEVNKSATLANHDAIIGIVVGGANTYHKIIEDVAQYNVWTAADANEDVIVQISGICYCISGGAWSIGDILIADTGTAGRLKAGALLAVSAIGLGTLAVNAADLTIAAGAVPVESTAANGAIIAVANDGLTGALTGGALSGDGTGRIIGKAIEAASGAAEIKKVLLSAR